MSSREVVVATLSDRYSAEFLVARLRDAGVPARITSRVEPMWTTGSPTSVMPVEVRVMEDRAAEARELIAAAEGDAAADEEGHSSRGCGPAHWSGGRSVIQRWRASPGPNRTPSHAIARGMRVTAPNGEVIGRVEELRFDDESGELRAILVRPEHAGGGSLREIPADHVDVRTEGVRLIESDARSPMGEQRSIRGPHRHSAQSGSHTGTMSAFAKMGPTSMRSLR